MQRPNTGHVVRCGVRDLGRERGCPVARASRPPEQAKRARVYYAALMGDTESVLVTMDGCGVLRWASPEVRPVLGSAPDEVPEGLRRLQEVLTNREALLRTVHRVRHANGSYRTMEVIGRDLRSRREIGAVVVHLRDVTAEQEVAQALVENRARLEEAYRIAGLGHWEHDLRSGEVQFSEQLVRLAGWKRQPTSQWRELRHLFVHPDDLARTEAVLFGAQAVERPISLELRVVWPDGSVRQWLVHAQGFTDGHGAMARLTATVMDVTERRQAEAELFRAQKLEALDLLSAGIAHDFNNLLTVIQGNLSLAKESVLHHPALPLLSEAEAACNRAAYLAHQLSRYARDGPVQPFEATHLVALLRDTVPFLLHGSRVRGEVEAPDGLWAVWGDAGELAQVLQNLVLNAVAAMPQGGMLRASAANALLPEGDAAVPLPPGPYVRLLVADSGRGVAPEHLPRIFDPYFTTREEGHGLGLATTYRIVRRHQGDISVQSWTGLGTVFKIYLPAVGLGAAAAGAAAGVPAPPELRRHLRVLVVDDEAMVLRSSANMLRELGCEAEVAASSEEAVSRMRGATARGCPFHVAILDVTMPGDLSAQELFERLWTVDPLLRGVVSSGYPHHDTMARHRFQGFRAALPKPYGLEELRAALATALVDDPPGAGG